MILIVCETPAILRYLALFLVKHLLFALFAKSAYSVLLTTRPKILKWFTMHDKIGSWMSELANFHLHITYAFGQVKKKSSNASLYLFSHKQQVNHRFINNWSLCTTQSICTIKELRIMKLHGGKIMPWGLVATRSEYSVLAALWIVLYGGSEWHDSLDFI